MRLINVYEPGDFSHLRMACDLLYKLLAERDPLQNISHKAMPTWFEHCNFVLSRPYAHWYIAEADGYARGAVYLTHQREIGIGILKAQRGHGYALDAVTELMRLHPGRFLWNVAPLNTPSIALARKLGFGAVPIQYTYAKEPG